MTRIFVFRRQLATSTLVAFTIAVSAACGGSDGHLTPTSPPPPPVAASVSITPATVALGVAATQQLSVTALTAGGDPIATPTVLWSSSNPTTVAVSAAGLVTALARGTAVITANVDGINATASVTVGTTSSHAFSIAPATYTLGNGDSVQLAASYVVDGVAQPTPGIIWTSSDTVNVRVSRYGRVISDGPVVTATITAKMDSLTATATVTVQRVTKSLPRVAYEMEVSDPVLYYEQIRSVYADGTNDSRVTPPLQTVLGWDVAPTGPSIVAMYGAASLNGGPYYGKIGGFVIPVDQYAETPLARLMTAPVWSPDGRQVAYLVWQQSGETDLGVVNADGSGARLLTSQPGSMGVPVWSPDSRRILSTHVPAGSGAVQLWITDMNGVTQQITTTASSPRNVAWAPDGARMVFDDGRDVWVMNADGTQQTRITNTCAPPSPCDNSVAAEYPTWSPDGTEIAYGTGSAIVIVHPDGTPVRSIAVAGLLRNPPRWSPNGAMLAFIAQQSGPLTWPSVWVVDHAGTNLHLVTTRRNVAAVRWIGGAQ